jgi:hypothetical protein
MHNVTQFFGEVHMFKTPKRKIYRQGDVLIQQIEKLPQGCNLVEWEDRVILAYGEVTGHAHAISTNYAKMYTWEGDRLLEIKPGAKLVHEEHGTIMLPEGFYKVIQQREYVPEAPPRDVLD